ncbi:hypothetical protein ARMGADRAFT_782250 [Armillaria gallica]|uniref:Uncharacterized protein n=1 Tax=Armillaria gallica TaxID=47427 RepID=A0A2H3CZ24_ARMGA|nr:hypothetical protein ARMGADRAFT_782250 [Armillaria gallica]
MTSCNTAQIPSYSATVDITSLLRSCCSPGRIDKITMAHVRLDMIAVDSLVQPRLDRIKELESEIARLRAEVDVISPTLDSLHAPIRRLRPEVLLSIFGHLEPGPMPLKDDAPWLLTRVCTSWRDLVTHTPTLWSTIKMDGPYNYWNLSHYHPHHQHYTSSDLSRTSPLLTSSLRYSQSVPLDITLISRLPTSIDRVTTPLISLCWRGSIYEYSRSYSTLSRRLACIPSSSASSTASLLAGSLPFAASNATSSTANSLSLSSKVLNSSLLFESTVRKVQSIESYAVQA